MEVLIKNAHQQPSSATTNRGSWAGRGSSRLLLACLLLVNLGELAAPRPASAAQAGTNQAGTNQADIQAPAAETSFWVETIRIENAERAQHHVILTESRLQPGQRYTEPELQNGRNRVVQLPFIIEAELSLERGSEPGRFALVIRVVEAKTWFLALDLTSAFFSTDVVLADPDPNPFTANLVGLVGRQFFLGRAGVLTTALGGKESEFQLQYSQFDLLERGIGLTFSYRVGLCEIDEEPPQSEEVCSSSMASLGTDPTFSTWNQTGNLHGFRTSLTIPVNNTFSLLAEGDLRLTQEGFKRPVIEPEDQQVFLYENLQELELRFAGIHDTLDDPVAPTSGLRFEAALSHRRTTGDFLRDVSDLPGAQPLEARISEWGASASLVRYWPRGSYSLFAKGDLFVGESDWKNLPIQDQTTLTDRATALRAGLGFGHTTHLWRSQQPGKLASLRLETDISASWNGTSPSSSLLDDSLPALNGQALNGQALNGLALSERNPLRSVRLRSALVYRNRRALLRFSLGYRELFLP
ncbi:MAG: hypothetical protein K0U98_18365 [Deltaproteobacteria bacterium]|nr:hypothetical protein [Deltaproteobacteria bacterium]